jgi:hypothetical protein
MFKTIKTLLHFFKQDINMMLLQLELKRKQKFPGSTFWEGINPEHTARLMKSLQQQRRQRSI